MDQVYTAINKFYEKCRNKLVDRTSIEQASAAVEGTVFLDLTIADMGNERWT